MNNRYDSTPLLATVSQPFPTGRRVPAAPAWLALLAACLLVMMSHARAEGAPLSLLELPMGEMRDSVMQAAENQWSGAATCSTTRTGVGVNRRAYFLETCIFNNTAGLTLYDEVPDSSHYYFLEGRLVQIAYEFLQVSNLKKMRRCARQDIKRLAARHDSDQHRPQAITVADDGRTVVSDAEIVPRIHVLSGPTIPSSK